MHLKFKQVFNGSAGGFVGRKHSALGLVGFNRSAKGSYGFKRSTKGFTLAELLICLMIIGEIATFTIPKVLQSQQGQASRAVAKEAAATITSAYQMYTLKTAPSASTTGGDLTPFMNYVRVDTSGTVDDSPTHGSGQLNCTAGNVCVTLHNGAKIWYWGPSFSGTATTNALVYAVDPDGKYSGTGTLDGPGKSVVMFLYFNGRITSAQNMYPGTYTGGTPEVVGVDPSWFGWN